MLPILKMRSQVIVRISYYIIGEESSELLLPEGGSLLVYFPINGGL